MLIMQTLFLQSSFIIEKATLIGLTYFILVNSIMYFVLNEGRPLLFLVLSNVPFIVV